MEDINVGGWVKEVSKGFSEWVTPKLRTEEWEWDILFRSQKKTIQTVGTAVAKPSGEKEPGYQRTRKQAGR